MGGRQGTSRAVRASDAPRARETRPRSPQSAKAPGGGPARGARRRPVRTGPGRLELRRAPRRLICTRKVHRDRKRAFLAAPRPRVVSWAWAAKSRPGAPRAAPPRASHGCGIGRPVCAVSGRPDARAAAFGAFPIFAARSRTSDDGLVVPLITSSEAVGFLRRARDCCHVDWRRDLGFFWLRIRQLEGGTSHEGEWGCTCTTLS